MKFLLYAGIHKNRGTGNVLRMYYLYRYFIKKNHKVKIVSNNFELAKKVISFIDNNNDVLSKDYRIEKFDTVIYDSPCINCNVVKELSVSMNTLIGLDYFNYNCPDIDIIINLYNHNQNCDSVGNCSNGFRPQVYSGVKYTILKSDIINNKRNFNCDFDILPKILITFGGEDPCSHTLTVLEKLQDKRVIGKVLVGNLNKDKNKVNDKYSGKFDILYSTPKIGKLMKKADIVICGGGTTLLESIYVGNPVISLGQNQREREFINYIGTKIPIFKLKDIDLLINKYNNKYFRDKIEQKYRNFVDGKGKKRILDICLEK